MTHSFNGPINPRYAVYARLHGRTPNEMLAFDVKRWPGGCMTGFILWMNEQKTKASTNARSGVSSDGHFIFNQGLFDQWLREHGEPISYNMGYTPSAMAIGKLMVGARVRVSLGDAERWSRHHAIALNNQIGHVIDLREDTRPIPQARDRACVTLEHPVCIESHIPTHGFWFAVDELTVIPEEKPNDMPDITDHRETIRLFTYPAPNRIAPRDVIGVAIDSKGRTLTTHLSSNVGFAKSDMGLISNKKHDLYKEKFPNGFVLQWEWHVPTDWEDYEECIGPRPGHYTVQCFVTESEAGIRRLCVIEPTRKLLIHTRKVATVEEAKDVYMSTKLETYIDDSILADKEYAIEWVDTVPPVWSDMKQQLEDALETAQHTDGDRLAVLFNLQAKLNARIGIDPTTFQDDEAKITEWSLNYIRALQQELAELTDSYSWKWWSKYQQFDRQNARVEVVDCFHFLISIAQVLGMSAEDVYQAYLAKNKVNHNRQDTGYTEKDHADSAHI